jgi:hypothetical protein
MIGPIHRKITIVQMDGPRSSLECFSPVVDYFVGNLYLVYADVYWKCMMPISDCWVKFAHKKKISKSLDINKFLCLISYSTGAICSS